MNVLIMEVLTFYIQAEDAIRREKNLEEAKKIVIKNDPSLPEPETVSQISYGYWIVQHFKCNAVKSNTALSTGFYVEVSENCGGGGWT